MSFSEGKTLRLIFPQWQGGNNAPYHLGAELLAWLAPEHSGPTEHVPVEPPSAGAPLEELGIVGRRALLKQLNSAQTLLSRHSADRLVILGGDCLVDLAPFAYLNERYQGDLAILWVDAHPDIMTPEQFNNAHAMVLGMLLGNGDPDFVQAVTRPLKPQNILYVGMHDPTDWEASEIDRLGLQNVSPAQITQHGSSAVLDWFKSTGAKHLAIHLDLDVLDPRLFRSLLFANPHAPEKSFEGVAQGQLSIEQVLDVLRDVAKITDVVGLGITEHLPWDALALKNMLARLPLIGDAGRSNPS